MHTANPNIMGEVVLLCRHSLKRPDRSIVGIVVLPKLKKHDPEMSSNLCPTAYFCILTLIWKKNIFIMCYGGNLLWNFPFSGALLRQLWNSHLWLVQIKSISKAPGGSVSNLHLLVCIYSVEKAAIRGLIWTFLTTCIIDCQGRQLIKAQHRYRRFHCVM